MVKKVVNSACFWYIKFESFFFDIFNFNMESSYPDNKLKILHFNDVYNISHDPKNQICGGIARFATKMQEIKKENPETVILFSGDLWSPSRRRLF